MNAKTTTPNRDRLFVAYKTVVNNWAIGQESVEEALGSLDARTTRRVLRALEAAGLLTSLHVNDEKALTWQSYFDAENEPNVARRSTAAFNKVFPKGVEVPDFLAEPAKNGGTGPRYSDEQIIKGHVLAVEAARSGKKLSNREIAEAVGVKSPQYFAKVRRARGAALLRDSKKVAPAAKKTTGRKVVRRGAAKK